MGCWKDLARIDTEFRAPVIGVKSGGEFMVEFAPEIDLDGFPVTVWAFDSTSAAEVNLTLLADWAANDLSGKVSGAKIHGDGVAPNFWRGWVPRHGRAGVKATRLFLRALTVINTIGLNKPVEVFDSILCQPANLHVGNNVPFRGSPSSQSRRFDAEILCRFFAAYESRRKADGHSKHDARRQRQDDEIHSKAPVVWLTAKDRKPLAWGLANTRLTTNLRSVARILKKVGREVAEVALESAL